MSREQESRGRFLCRGRFLSRGRGCNSIPTSPTTLSRQLSSTHHPLKLAFYE